MCIFYFLRTLERGKVEPWPSFCKPSLVRKGNGTCDAWKWELIFCLTDWPVSILLCLVPETRTRPSPIRPFCYFHFFTCFAIVLYITIFTWRAYIFKPFAFLLDFANKLLKRQKLSAACTQQLLPIPFYPPQQQNYWKMSIMFKHRCTGLTHSCFKSALYFKGA